MLRKSIGLLFAALSAILLLSVIITIMARPSGESSRLLPSLVVIFFLSSNVYAAYYLNSSRSWRPRYLVPLSLEFTLSTLMISYFLMVTFVNHKLKDRSYTGVYSDCHKVWAARGLVVEGPSITHNGTQNSIESIELAFSKGAKGAEVDHYYDADLKQFIVSHDRPYNLKNGSLLTLEMLFNATAENGFFWLDFKKLRKLNKEEARTAVLRLEAITEKYDLKKRIYVEGENPTNLSAFRKAGFNTILDTHPLTDNNPFTPLVINLYKAIYYFGGFTVMAMNNGSIDDPIYGPHTQNSMGNIPVFIYHAEDDIKLLASLSASRSVRVVIMDNHSLNRYQFNDCDGVSGFSRSYSSIR